MTNEEAPVVNQLSDMLRYQAGSVVSRVLLKNKGGTVKLFDFSKGEGLSEHTAPFEVISSRREQRLPPAFPTRFALRMRAWRKR